MSRRDKEQREKKKGRENEREEKSIERREKK